MSKAARALSDFLQRTGTTQDALARIIGVSQPTVAYYLRGRHVPSDATKRRIRKATRGAVRVGDWPTTRPGPKPTHNRSV